MKMRKVIALCLLLTLIAVLLGYRVHHGHYQ